MTDYTNYERDKKLSKQLKKLGMLEGVEDTKQEVTPIEDREDFNTELCSLLNRYSMENSSNTPDFILRDYLLNCLDAFNRATNLRTKWFKNDK